MSEAETRQRTVVDWGVAGRPMAGQELSGDLHVVQPFDEGVLLAVIDGVGHGAEAIAAARVAAGIVSEHASESVLSLIRHCHQAMAGTRGAVVTLASLNALENTVTWLGVGNVEGHLLRTGAANNEADESLLLRNGLVGFQLPALQAAVLPLEPGDALIFATDGIRRGFERGLNRAGTPQQVADWILTQHFKGTDDALVLVARYAGLAHE
jgi:negative regulator of sigma-B (phosphoserine phosphatase)